ncbi:anti-sigma factor family protein [Streptomyces boninensis]|uniref:anti-sigma factor family protein n=1 Tax=Streptomyces boninensis TaxID=2039455 RepID=UPI003B22325A
MTTSGGSSPAEHHLGDRLAALVDGELCHDTRDRVLAHLATCPKCKAEADAQRQLKSVFAATAPPPPSAGLMARLQNLPGLDDDELTPGGGNPFRPDPAAELTPLPSTRAAELVAAGSGEMRAAEMGRAGQGFRIHEIARPGSASRGRRFAFAAAGAVSFAAIALGGALPIEAAVDSSGTPDGGRGGLTTPAGSGAGADSGPPAPSATPGGGAQAGEQGRRGPRTMVYPYTAPNTAPAPASPESVSYTPVLPAVSNSQLAPVASPLSPGARTSGSAAGN